ncbi:MAG TPA: hypothetical protein VFG09_02985 [Thermodesulfovibrionales bacterium]|nr:hypothetical protein [Thermodesulfovibrionales bacterium]
MNPPENPSPDYQESLSTLAEEKRTLTGKLVRALKENSALHDRLAELHVTMSIKTAELQREIDDLTRERKDLLEENEALLQDLSSQETASGVLSQSLTETRPTREEMQRQLDAGKRHMEEFELKFIDLENRYKAILKEKENLKVIAGEQEDRLLTLIHEKELAEKPRTDDEGERKLHADAIAAKNEEIEKYRTRVRELLDMSNEAEGFRTEITNLTENAESLRRLNESLREEKERIEKESLQTAAKLSTLEKELLSRDESIRHLREELSRLEGAIPSSGKTKESFFERFRRKNRIQCNKRRPL